MSQQTKRFCDFGPFRIDRQKRTLSMESKPLPLPPKAFDVLLFLMEHRDRVIEKSEFMQAIWPDSFVEEGNLSQNIFLLRKTLGDGQEGQRFILTVPGVGYRFAADVVESDEVAGQIAAPDARPNETKISSPNPLQAVAGAALLLLVLGVGFVWYRLTHATAHTLAETQLTTNASEASLTAACISPDGKYLAFSDEHGTYIRQIGNGDTYPLSLPRDTRIFGLSWFPDGSKILATGLARGNSAPSLWSISLLGRDARKLRDEVDEAAPSPDGSKILFTTSAESEIWVMGSNGEEPKKVLTGPAHDAFAGLAWFPDGTRILFIRYPVVEPETVESVQLDGTQPALIVSARSLIASTFLPSGRLLYAVWTSAQNEAEITLWEVPVDLKTGRAAGGTKVTTKWRNAKITGLTATADGKRLMFLKGLPQGDVYVGDLEKSRAAPLSPRRLTLNDRDDVLSGWTPDSKSVLFSSNRNGTYDIFKQSLDEPNASPLVESKNVKTRPRMSPDGKWVIYYDPPAMLSRDERGRLSRIPLLGGPPETVMEEQGLYVFRCAQAPANRCVVGILHTTELILYELDPIKGRGPELLRIPVNADEESPNLDISPDGKTIAYVSLSTHEGRITLYSLTDNSKRSIELKDWHDLDHIDWAADSKGWYVSSEMALTSALLYVKPDGSAAVLWREPGLFSEVWAIPSPDGKHLAFIRYNSGNNAWVLEGF